MNLKGVLECERKALKKYENISLKHSYKKVGVLIFIVGIISLIAFKFIENEPEILKDFVKKLILIGLLVFAVSRDKIEDELTMKLRGQAFAVAFIFGIVYAIVQPYITYIIATILGKENKGEFLQLGDFQLLFFMLIIQIGFYWMYKKYR